MISPMSIAFDEPWWLLLCLVGPISGIVCWRWMRGIPVFRRSIAVLLRVVLFVILGIAMSGVYRVETANDVAVIAVVDTSASVQSFASLGVDELGVPITIDRAARGFLAGASAGRESNDRLGIIAFDGRAQTIALPTKSRVLDRAIETIAIEGSDIAGAIEQARMQLPPDANVRVVLFSDGRTTSGSLDELPSDVQIDVVPIRYNVTQEVVLEAVELPARSLPDSIVEVRVVLRSLGNSTGQLLLQHNNEAVDLNGDESGVMRRVSLVAGQQVFVLPVQLGSGRVHRFEARYIPDPITGSGVMPNRYAGDTSLGNNQAGGVTMSSGEGRVLVVADQDASDQSQAHALLNTLNQTSWSVESLPLAQFPLDLLTLESYDLIVLVNTPRDAIGLEADALIHAYVHELGGGVIFVGGREALGAGGWQGTKVEEILPIKLDVADDLMVPPVAVVMVLHSSGSMRNRVLGSSQSQQAVANDSAAGAIEILNDDDLVGVVSFATNARQVVPIGPNDQPESTKNAIGSIPSSGGTNMVPALEMARDMLESVDAGTKHIVLLSDGESQNSEELPELAQAIGDLGIKVSTIAVGDQADENGMSAIARLSGGTYYRVRVPSVLPRIFLKAIRVVRTPNIREANISPIVLDQDSPVIGSMSNLPGLSGLVMSERITDDPRVSTPIVSDQGEPIFAFHQVELGRVSVFTSDVARWARRWIESPVFASFWTKVANWTMRTDANEPGELSLVIDGTSAQIEYNAIDSDGVPIDGLEIQTQVFDAAGRSRSVDLVQVGTGQYTGSLDQLSNGVHVIIASPSNGGQAMKPTIAGMQISGVDEFKHLSADPNALIALADRTGGRVFALDDPASANLFDRVGLIERRSLQPMWMLLLAIAFVLFVLDLAARRVAFDRWIAQARDETLAVSRTLGAQMVGAQQVQRLKDSKSSTQSSKPEAPEIDRRPMAPTNTPKADPKPEPAKSTEPVGDQKDKESSNPLLAAKRRARERMDED